MGTKVHRDSSYFNHAMRNLNDDFDGNNWGKNYRENGKTNGQRYYNVFIDRKRDEMKQKMLEHEAIFKSQLHELHRLYKIQKELMEDVKKIEKKELQSSRLSIEPRPSSSSSGLRGPHLHGGFPLLNYGHAGASTSGVEIGNSPLNGSGIDSRPSKVRKKLFDLRFPAEKYTDAKEEEAEKERVDLNEPANLGNGFSMNSGFESRLNGGHLPRIFEAGSSEEIMHLPYGFFTSSSSYNDSWAHSSSSSSTQKKFVFDPSLNSIATISRSYLHSNGNGDSRHNVQRRMMDIDLNEVISEENKTTVENVSALPLNNHCEATKTVKKILEIPIFDTFASEYKTKSASTTKENKKRVLDINLACDAEDELSLEKEKNRSEFCSTKDVMIDLNCSIVESDEPSSPLSNVSLRVNRILEIDLESLPVGESEDESSAEIANCDNSYLLQSVDKIEVSNDDEDLTNAAETIFAISSFCPSVEGEEPLLSSENLLLRFADLVSSFSNGDEWGKNQLLPKEIDDFEAMTLQLQEMREDGDYKARPVLREPEETGPANSSMTRPRRGQPRRARQKKDFQRDILPSLSTLSRQEVKEDLQTFGALMSAMGHHWNGPKNGGRARGRRRAWNDVQSHDFDVPLVPKLGPVLEDRRSITGWGKTTRRPRRQRCAAYGNNSPLRLL